MSYSQKQKIGNSVGGAGYNFGSAVDIDGYYLLSGEEGNNTAYIYKRNINGIWENIKKATR